MPVYSTRDLIPFVNSLESKLLNMNSSIDEWDREKYKIISSSKKTDSNYTTAMMALVRADEAMAELGTATFKSTASRGKRLEDTLNKLRSEMYDIASLVGEGGGGSLTEGMFYDELNNAIASVDVTIEDGLRLDYRLREITDKSLAGELIATKDLHMPYKYDVASPTKEVTVLKEAGVVFVEGEVTVLNEAGDPFLDENRKIITGVITKDGNVTLSSLPPSGFSLYFPVQMKLKDIPEDFLYLFLQQIVQKNSRIMETVLRFEDVLNGILGDIEEMKGVHWTPDHSIMRNHQEVVKEGITPKGLNVEVKDGLAHVTFSYNDHPYLNHFVLEKWDEDRKAFVPYDGVSGIVQK